MIIVSENCIALAALLLRQAGSMPGDRGQSAIVARELDRSGSQRRARMFSLGSVEETAAHARAADGDSATRPFSKSMSAR